MGATWINRDAVAQDFQDQEDLVQEDEAEPSDATVDQDAHWQHYQIQRQASSLASHKAGLVSCEHKSLCRWWQLLGLVWAHSLLPCSARQTHRDAIKILVPKKKK